MCVGSGFIIDPTGYIVTNNHVVADTDQISVTLNDGTKLKATIVGRDPRTDLALLKVSPPWPLSFVSWGDSKRCQVGDYVLAIGNPFGLGGSVTHGIISYIGRDIPGRTGSAYIDGYFQTDAPINMGNSGGPMLNIKGEVIGVNTSIYSPTGSSVGIGFAIPSFVCQPVIEQIKKFGRTKRGRIGIVLQVVDQEIAESVNLPKPIGVLVARVIPGGPAHKAGVLKGDIVLRINGVVVENPRSFPRMVADLPIGVTVPLVVWRKDKKTNQYKTKDIIINIEEYKDVSSSASLKNTSKKEEEVSIEEIGLKSCVLTPELRRHFDVSQSISGGVLVTEVELGSSSDEQDIKAGDVILEVDQEAVHEPKDIVLRIKKSKNEKRKSLLLFVARDEDTRFVSVKLMSQTPKP